MKQKLRILSLGAGVQSSALAMLIEQGKIPMVDAAIFADVGAEPDNVIEWLEWLKTKVSYPIYVVQWRNLKEDLINVTQGKYKKVPIPFFSLSDENKKEWEEVVKLEKAFNDNRKLISKVTGVKDKIFFTRKCEPIGELDFDEKTDQLDLFNNDCDGYCGI